jgi:enamine deaminase RidA (YjgF/YER057c/UK114 family)
MTGRVDARLNELQIELPRPTTPSANYVPFKRSGSLMFIAGQVPTVDGKDQVVGKVGRDVSLEDGQKAARLCAINVLAQLKASLNGDLDRVVGCVRLGGFVNAVPDFGDHSKVINGASDLMVAVFGEAGCHARAAVGCASLPRNVAVEVEAVFEVE